MGPLLPSDLYKPALPRLIVFTSVLSRAEYKNFTGEGDPRSQRRESKGEKGRINIKKALWSWR